MNRLAITKLHRNDCEFVAYIALDEKRDFVDFELFEAEETLLDHIVIARVETVVSNINAAFVMLSATQKAFLPLEHIERAFFTKKISVKKPISQGDELLVRVVRDAVGGKEPVVSVDLSICGMYTVVHSDSVGVSVSKKLSAETRERLRAVAEEEIRCTDALKYPSPEENNAVAKEDGIIFSTGGDGSAGSPELGVILRTNAAQAKEPELREDIRTTIERYRMLRANAPHRTAYSILYQSPPGYIRRLRTLRTFLDYDRIITDVPALYEQIAEHLPYLRESGALRLYDDPQVSLAVLYNLRGNVDKLLAKRVYLPGGGNIIIERTEAMTVIDVNSAADTHIAKGDAAKERLVLSVNLEAAHEVARQLRLRNIGGMILVDFINMKSGESIKALIGAMKAELKQDVVPARFVDMTGLGLMEITRKKVSRSLAEIVQGDFRSCRTDAASPVCTFSPESEAFSRRS